MQCSREIFCLPCYDAHSHAVTIPNCFILIFCLAFQTVLFLLQSLHDDGTCWLWASISTITSFPNLLSIPFSTADSFKNLLSFFNRSIESLTYLNAIFPIAVQHFSPDDLTWMSGGNGKVRNYFHDYRDVVFFIDITVLYGAVLYCMVLCCTVLYWTSSVIYEHKLTSRLIFFHYSDWFTQY